MQPARPRPHSTHIFRIDMYSPAPGARTFSQFVNSELNLAIYVGSDQAAGAGLWLWIICGNTELSARSWSSIHKTMRQNDVASLISDYPGDSNTRQIESVTRIRIFPFPRRAVRVSSLYLYRLCHASSRGKVASNHVLLWPGYGQCWRGRNTEVGVDSLRSQSARAAFRGRARSWLAAAANIIKSWISPKFSSLTLHWAGHSRTPPATTGARALIKLKRNSKPCMWPCTCHTQPVIIALKNIWSTKWKIFGHHRCCEMLTIGVLERNWVLRCCGPPPSCGLQWPGVAPRSAGGWRRQARHLQTWQLCLTRPPLFIFTLENL